VPTPVRVVPDAPKRQRLPKLTPAQVKLEAQAQADAYNLPERQTLSTLRLASVPKASIADSPTPTSQTGIEQCAFDMRVGSRALPMSKPSAWRINNIARTLFDAGLLK
jgi:hypothetical protein